MTAPDQDIPPEPAPRDYDRVSHGYAPEGRAEAPPPEPLDAIVRDVVVNLSATAQAEMALLEARGSLAWHAIKWTAGWGFVAACALLVAMLAIAFGAIMVLAPRVGPLAATLIVFGALIALAAFTAWRALHHWRDLRTALRRDLAHEVGEEE
ncbi:phage holin family protein [Sphingopyxis indica]|uniref:Putative Holin-X, holin superfamily III n=1 Tax=Sphingopyxis indica TaxID=436663 RepID=A0A239LHD2_9SPHN|nr:phage holin family protein [Sphingopyxis indica]WOF41898.1 phage holin family protein [Sphingopyxis indica]SNT29079.1 Putative Holin-X, holin superfamily III [Sphingopyxis indica]